MILLVLILLIVGVPLLELYVIIQVAHVVGAWQTIALLLGESLFGAWLLKRQGLHALRRISEQLQNRQLPHRELIDGFLILLAGALMLAPGFVTDAIGLLLLIPPIRIGVRTLILRHFEKRINRGLAGWFGTSADGRTWAASFGGGRGQGRVWVDSTVVDRHPNTPDHPEIGPGPTA